MQLPQEQPEDYMILAGFLIGLGVGMILDRILPYVVLGGGVGFLAAAISKKYGKKNN